MSTTSPAPLFTALSTLLLLLFALVPLQGTRADPYLGTYNVTAVAPGGACTYAHPQVTSSQNWYVGDVKVNGVVLTEGVDYTVVDDGSNKGLVRFLVPLVRGDRIVISGTTLEPGAHTGTITFF